MDMPARIDTRVTADTGPRPYGKVAVLMGGRSAEREISLQTGEAVLAAMQRRHIDAWKIDARDDYLLTLKDEAFDRVFIALHGRGGEDGSVQGALEIMGIPYTGSGIAASALAMDKVRSKWIWQSQGLSTPPFLEISTAGDLDLAADLLGFPMMVKPVQEGSSCGASKVDSIGQLAGAVEQAGTFDRRVMAERWITGAEYTAGILDASVLPLIRLETPRTFYDFEAKYVADSTRYICPSGLDARDETAIAGIAMKAFELLGASGWGRVDMMLDAAGTPWLLEVNTIPGMTSHSLVPMGARAAGIEFDELVWRILETSLES